MGSSELRLQKSRAAEAFAAARVAGGEVCHIVLVRVGFEHLRAQFWGISDVRADSLSDQAFGLGPAGRAVQASARFAGEAPFTRLA